MGGTTAGRLLEGAHGGLLAREGDQPALLERLGEGRARGIPSEAAELASLRQSSPLQEYPARIRETFAQLNADFGRVWFGESQHKALLYRLPFFDLRTAQMCNQAVPAIAMLNDHNPPIAAITASEGNRPCRWRDHAHIVGKCNADAALTIAGGVQFSETRQQLAPRGQDLGRPRRRSLTGAPGAEHRPVQRREFRRLFGAQPLCINTPDNIACPLALRDGLFKSDGGVGRQFASIAPRVAFQTGQGCLTALQSAACITQRFQRE